MSGKKGLSGRKINSIGRKRITRELVKAGVRDWLKEKQVMEELLNQCKDSLEKDFADNKKISADNAAKWASAMEKVIRTLKMLYGEIVIGENGEIPNIHSVIVMFINRVEGKSAGQGEQR